jgi:hypothetical protein
MAAGKPRASAKCSDPRCVAETKNAGGRIYRAGGVEMVLHSRGSNGMKGREGRKMKFLDMGWGTCTYCGCELDADTLTQDRIKSGCRYIMANLIPACLPCNNGRSDSPWQDQEMAHPDRIPMVMKEHAKWWNRGEPIVVREPVWADE